MAKAEEVVFEDPATYSLNNPIHTCFFARNGVGKTTFAGKTDLKTVLLDCGDAGAVTLRKIAKNHLKIIKIKSTNHYLDAIDKINRLADEIDLVVVDTMSGLQARAIREVKGRSGEMNQRKWGQVSSKVIECIIETRNFPKDVIYFAQEKYRTVEEGADEIGPALTPSIVGTLSNNLDWVGWMYLGEDSKGEVCRKIDFRIREGLEVKDRAGLFKKVLVNASYTDIRNRIINELRNGN